MGRHVWYFSFSGHYNDKAISLLPCSSTSQQYATYLAEAFYLFHSCQMKELGII